MDLTAAEVAVTDSQTAQDHFELEDTRVTRRYFAKFRKITEHLTRVAATMQSEGSLSRQEVEVLARYLMALNASFAALAHKYHFSGRFAHAGKLTFDRLESGFPVFAELMTMANDAAQATRHLAGMRSQSELKDEMVRVILRDRRIPDKLQFAMSQRLYYEELAKGELFWARNDPQAIWLGNVQDRRRQFLVHWAVYDSQINLPTIYLMELEDTGRVGLPKDDRRWPEVQAHLMAQALAHLKLLTIARGFDEDFDDLHPKRLRRFHLGPMYSHAFTQQTGPLNEVLKVARAPEGDDWALVWTEEDLTSDRADVVKSGWFGFVERQIFALDPFAGTGAETGASSTQRSIILPQRPYQALEERNPPGFDTVRKYVVSPQGRVLSYR